MPPSRIVVNNYRSHGPTEGVDAVIHKSKSYCWSDTFESIEEARAHYGPRTRTCQVCLYGTT